MEWLEAERHGSTVYQKTKLPHKYEISYQTTERGLGVFRVAYQDEVFSNLYVNDPRNRAMVREIGRAARVLCASHASASASPSEGRFARRPAEVRDD